MNRYDTIMPNYHNTIYRNNYRLVIVALSFCLSASDQIVSTNSLKRWSADCKKDSLLHVSGRYSLTTICSIRSCNWLRICQPQHVIQPIGDQICCCKRVPQNMFRFLDHTLSIHYLLSQLTQSGVVLVLWGIFFLL